MPKNVTDGVLGARASNAGDRFHELWALRKALTLLEPSSPYSAITVEGVPETDTPPDEIAWSAVDVCLLTGGTRIQDASKVEFAQLKYSSTNPTSAWTAARLSHSSAKKGNNSVIKRLADVYAAAEAEKKSTNPKLSYSIRLVSNQPVSPEVLQALGQAAAHANDKVRADKNRTQLLSATGLTKGEFKRFAAQLDFSECGASSLFEQEKQAIQALDRMTEGDSRGTHLELLSFISGAMLPTGSREPITEEVLLSHLGIGTERSLYPCPNLVKSLSVIVERPVVGQVVQSLVAGTQHLCVQGGAGCGKTTAVAQLGQKLPSGSVCILFDCYGGGSYLDESAPRHRPVEAFTQLANEVATRLKVPRLLRLADKGLPAKAFKDRLTLAAHVLREANPGALLVIAIDAADNAVTAAEKRDEHCFVRELATFTDLPDNVRIVITARPSRVASLDLPPYFSFQTIEAFDVNETLSNVRNYIQNPDSVWVREFHDLSRGNPRVQAYAFGFSTVPRDAIQFLLPSGKELGDVFAASVYSAWQKNGGLASVEQLCAALIALPRPVPLTELAHAIVADATLVAELCQDLYPTLVVKAGTVSFADEDFEDFVRDRGANALKTVQSRIATGLMDRACHNEYAARHVVHALISAGKKREALRFASDEESLALLRDPMERRLCQLDRMRSAIRVCEETNSKPDSLFILLTGAEALRTTDAITKELANNCDLAIRHARDTVERLVLGDEEYFEAHGPLFFHAMAEDSKQKLFAQVDRSHRLFIAWNERNRHSRSYRKHHQNLTVRDVAAYFRAILVTRGPQEMLSRARRRLGSDRLRVITEVVGQLLEEGNVALVESVTREATSWHSLGLLVQAMLMAAGCEVALSDIEKSLLRFQTRGRFLASTSARRQASGFLTRLPDEYVLGLSEALSRSKASQAVVRNVLGDMLADETPRWKSIRPSDYERMDTVLRAECLLAALHVESVEVSKLWGVPTSEMRQSWQSTSGISHEDHQRRSKLVELTAALLPYYQARAQYVISGRGSDFWGNENPAWLGKLIDGSYLADAQGKLSIRFRVAASTSSLTMLHGADAPKLLSLVIALLDENRPTFEHRELEILRTFAWRSETHSQLAQFADKRRAAISAAKTSSSEKASSLLELSRLLLECCPAESASLFNAAVLVLGEIDQNEMRLLQVLGKFSSTARGALDASQRHSTAISIASYGTAVAYRLQGYDNFPWRHLSSGLASLHMSASFAAIGRWDDEGLASLSETLPDALATAVANGTLGAARASLCCYLLARYPESLVSAIAQAAARLSRSDRDLVGEILAQNEVVEPDGQVRLGAQEAILKTVGETSQGRWTTYLAARQAFLLPALVPSSVAPAGTSDDDRASKIEALLGSLSWDNHLFDTPEYIESFCQEAYEKARSVSLYVIDRQLHSKMRSCVPAHLLTHHLAALARLVGDGESRRDIADALVEASLEWYARSGAVRDWCSVNLDKVVAGRLPLFMAGMYDASPLQKLIDSGILDSETLYRMLLTGIGENLEDLDAHDVYTLAEFICHAVSPSVVATVLERYSDRLMNRVEVDDKFDVSDVPMGLEDAFARFLYAYLGDAEVAVRWRAARAVSGLFWFEDAPVIHNLVAQYPVSLEPTFRSPAAPFYWLAARLWLTIAIAKGCHDRPSFAQHFAGHLLSVLDDETFPHIPVRLFAKHGLKQLARSQMVQLTKHQKRTIKLVDSSPLKRRKRSRKLDLNFEKSERQVSERRFHFDSLDTLRYWYPSMAEMFSDVSLKEFVDEAERWIVDKWNVTSNPWKWVDEVRREKFKYRPQAMHHSHHGTPQVERFSTHLEWHAMWCAAGAFLKNRPLSKGRFEGHDEDVLHSQLEQISTLQPGVWGSDLRCPKPLEKRFWMRPDDDIDWVEAPSVVELVEILGLEDASEWGVVDGNYERRWKQLRETVEISSCLVSSSTATSLVRALQNSKHIFAHYLPRAREGEYTIGQPPFELRGWLRYSEGSFGLDSKDDLSENLSPRMIELAKDVRETLHLKRSARYLGSWENTVTSQLVIYAEQWADQMGERPYWQESDWVQAKGQRVHCRLDALFELLHHTQRDLFVRVHTHKEVYEEDHRYQESEEREREYFNQYLILRGSGIIESAEGPVGAWKISS